MTYICIYLYFYIPPLVFSVICMHQWSESNVISILKLRSINSKIILCMCCTCGRIDKADFDWVFQVSLLCMCGAMCTKHVQFHSDWLKMMDEVCSFLGCYGSLQAETQFARSHGTRERPQHSALGLTVGLDGELCGCSEHAQGCSRHLHISPTVPNRQPKDAVVIIGCHGSLQAESLAQVASVVEALGVWWHPARVVPWLHVNWVLGLKVGACWVKSVGVVKVPGCTGTITIATFHPHSPTISPRTQSAGSLLHSPQGAFIRALMLCLLMQPVPKSQPAGGSGGKGRPRHGVLGLTVGLGGWLVWVS